MSTQKMPGFLTISKLIPVLEKIQKEMGDLEIGVIDDHCRIIKKCNGVAGIDVVSPDTLEETTICVFGSYAGSKILMEQMMPQDSKPKLTLVKNEGDEK